MVNNTHRIYDKYLSQVTLCRDIIEGDARIKEKSTEYIPKLPLQDAKAYKAMISRPSFDNFTGKMLDGLTGLVFAKTPVYELPQKTESYIKSIDLGTNNDVDIAQILLEEVLVTSRAGILVDLSNTTINEPVNGAVIEKLNIRPYAKIYKNESIINWRYENNKLVMVVLKEVVEDWEDEFTTKSKTHYRVLSLTENGYLSRVFELEGKDTKLISSVYPTMNGKSMDFIPFIPINPMNLDIIPSKPPLYDMAVTNLSSHKLKIDLYHALYFTVPTPYGSGIEDKDLQITIGATELHLFSNPNAKLQYLEFHGDGLKNITTEIEECKKSMAALGNEFLRDRTRGVEAAETVAMRTSGDRATLQSVSDTVSRAMTLMFKYFAMWLNEPTENISYKLNTDYSLTTANPQMINAYAQLHTLGLYSDYDFFYRMKQIGEIDETLTFEDWQSRRDTQGVKLQ